MGLLTIKLSSISVLAHFVEPVTGPLIDDNVHWSGQCNNKQWFTYWCRIQHVCALSVPSSAPPSRTDRAVRSSAPLRCIHPSLSPPAEAGPKFRHLERIKLDEVPVRLLLLCHFLYLKKRNQRLHSRRDWNQIKSKIKKRRISRTRQ